MFPVDVFQCPVCALKFRFSSELDQHLSLEHPNFSAEDDDPGDAALKERERKKRDLKP